MRRLNDRGEGGDVADALDVIRLSRRVYHYVCWDGVRQAVSFGATEGRVAIALGMSIPDTRDLIRRIHERDREVAKIADDAGQCRGRIRARRGAEP
ncbi:hypothetical protein ACFWRZ_32415 [Streptomyces rubiginosohelvolus]|uniref:hypothetical protein n=1 Tax=Streptomyces rubiginosohelvolus TaxID=67362 RepID=UPI00364EEBE5